MRGTISVVLRALLVTLALLGVALALLEELGVSAILLELRVGAAVLLDVCTIVSVFLSRNADVQLMDVAPLSALRLPAMRLAAGAPSGRFLAPLETTPARPALPVPVANWSASTPISPSLSWASRTACSSSSCSARDG